MSQTVDTEIQELDTVVLTHDLPSHHLKQGQQGAVVHCYQDGKAFEVEFLDSEGDAIALLTLTTADVCKLAQ
jgi:hypothetical protein